MATPVDQLGLLILAHMYHHHFCVFLHNRVWTTRRNNSMEFCKIFFVYKGNSNLVDTVLTDIFNPVQLSAPAVPAVPLLHASRRASPDHQYREKTPTPPPTDGSDSGSSIERGSESESEYENIFNNFAPDIASFVNRGVEDEDQFSPPSPDSANLVQRGVEEQDQFSPPPPDSGIFTQEGVEDKDQFSPPPAKRTKTTFTKFNSRAKEVLDRLRQEKKSRQKEKEIIKKNIAAMKRRAQEE